jgi:hypothetical protein
MMGNWGPNPNFRFLRPGDMDQVESIDEWLDSETGQEYKDQPLAQDWARTCKGIEELGESVDALIGYTAQNPRKGMYGSEEDLLNEQADSALTAIYAIQHFTKDKFRTADILGRRLRYHHDRMVRYYAENRSHP